MNHAVVISMPLQWKTVTQALHVCIVLIFKSTKQWQICLYTLHLIWLCMWLLFAKLNWDTGLISDRFRVVTLLLSLEISYYHFQVNISNVVKQHPGVRVVMTVNYIEKLSSGSPQDAPYLLMYSEVTCSACHDDKKCIQKWGRCTHKNTDTVTQLEIMISIRFCYLIIYLREKKIDVHVSKKALKTVTAYHHNHLKVCGE